MENLNFEAYSRLTRRDKINSSNTSSTKSSQLNKSGRDKTSSTKAKHGLDAAATSATATTVILHPNTKPKTPLTSSLQKYGKIKRTTSRDSRTDEKADEKPAKNRLGSPVQKGKPWGSLLRTNDINTLDSCDPLRTLHFLVKEMQHKVKTEVPASKNLGKIVNEMLAAISRVPSELESLSRMKQGDLGKDKLHTSISRSSRKDEFQVIKSAVADKGCQTISTRLYDEMLSKEMEATTAKLEASYKQMEIFCEKINMEKQELERNLRVERETVSQLRNQIQDTKLNDQLSASKIQQLEEERNELARQIQSMKTICETQHNQPNKELKAILQELRSQKLAAEQETLSIKHHITLLDLEKEKYRTLLEVREKQMQEIRGELNQLQEVVNHQLTELQKQDSTMQISNSLLDKCLSSIGMPALDYESSSVPSAILSENNGTVAPLNKEQCFYEYFDTRAANNNQREDTKNFILRELEKLEGNCSKHMTQQKDVVLKQDKNLHKPSNVKIAKHIRNMFQEVVKDALCVSTYLNEFKSE